MNNIIKSIVAGLIVLMFFSIVGTRVQTVTNRQVEDELSYALRVATQDATSVLVDRNHMMDGKAGDTGNFRVNLDTAEDQFRKKPCPKHRKCNFSGIGYDYEYSVVRLCRLSRYRWTSGGQQRNISIRVQFY